MQCCILAKRDLPPPSLLFLLIIPAEARGKAWIILLFLSWIFFRCITSTSMQVMNEHYKNPVHICIINTLFTHTFFCQYIAHGKQHSVDPTPNTENPGIDGRVTNSQIHLANHGLTCRMSNWILASLTDYWMGDNRPKQNLQRMHYFFLLVTVYL